ncbi:hypothetical protein BAE44_0005071 [Dichanthelium oligosanthes]|uniref:Uncharacterized protein n=1 Tax=Dichanthelium oligosanthes TaxID=888268 RepID=A0A1E5W908_9POAL|nr:hypothetical protein BAE44_0005071 [Dichanthelium oligosanthes]
MHLDPEQGHLCGRGPDQDTADGGRGDHRRANSDTAKALCGRSTSGTTPTADFPRSVWQRCWTAMAPVSGCCGCARGTLSSTLASAARSCTTVVAEAKMIGVRACASIVARGPGHTPSSAWPTDSAVARCMCSCGTTTMQPQTARIGWIDVEELDTLYTLSV